MKVKPLRDRVLIRPMGENEKTASGIIIPVSSQKTQNRGEVMKIGSTVTEVSVGDIVLVGQFSGTEVTIDSVDYKIVNEKDILCVI